MKAQIGGVSDEESDIIKSKSTGRQGTPVINVYQWHLMFSLRADRHRLLDVMLFVKGIFWLSYTLTSTSILS